MSRLSDRTAIGLPIKIRETNYTKQSRYFAHFIMPDDQKPKLKIHSSAYANKPL